MKEIFSDAGMIRVWDSDVPVSMFQFNQEDVIQSSLMVSGEFFPGKIAIAVESFFSSGPRVICGLLGCTYELMDCTELEVLTGFNDLSERCVGQNLTCSAGECFLGLDRRSAQAVSSELSFRIENAAEEFCTGRIVINFAIFSEIGSSPNLFKALAASLVDELVLKLKEMRVKDVG
ncbi:hypothetical protein [Chromobacterium violaceum]|uniref:hypothetical protein n=1 Tax=Chromobacterium violaceum TaxID=536 RepID=UPI00111C8654|nr:hypothetical protein [Chromobacterium violaceum]